jgi:hypothetical protein
LTIGADQSSARDSSCGTQTCHLNSQQLSATTSSTEIYRVIQTPWFSCPRRNKLTFSIIHEGDPSYGTSSQLPDVPLAAAKSPIHVRHHEVSGHRSLKSRSNSHSIGPFVFDQDVNPPCLSYASDEEKMSGWSPKNKSPDFIQSTCGLTRYTEFRIGGIPTPEEVSSSGHGECYEARQDSREDVCRNGVRSFVFA